MTLGSSSGEYIIARNATLSYIPSYFKRKSKKFRVYRAFWVSNDEKIRSTNDKSDVKFYEQSAGYGLSYSLSKTYPIFMIGAKFSVEYLRRYSTLPEHEFLQLSDQRTLGPSLTHVLARKAASLNQRPIIGTYEIDKSDVVALLANDEEEVLTLKKPKFLRYDPITYADAFASELLVMYNRDQQSTNIAKYKLNPSETPVSYLHKLREKYLMSNLKLKYLNQIATDPKLKFAELHSSMLPDNDASLAQLDLKLKEIHQFIHIELKSNLTF